MQQPDIYSRHARRMMRARMSRAEPGDRWVLRRMADEVAQRLAAVTAQLRSVLVIGEPSLADAFRAPSRDVLTCDAGALGVDVRCDEDLMSIGDGRFDLVVALGVLDSVNDVPGALVLIRRMLRPEGLFLGAMVGAGSLSTLRQCLAPDIARIHPQIDVRAAGDLLARAGFALPVADMESVEVRYSGIDGLFRDLRANGLRNCLSERRALGRRSLTEAATAFHGRASSGRTSEHLNLIYLTGWSPQAGKRDQI